MGIARLVIPTQRPRIEGMLNEMIGFNAFPLVCVHTPCGEGNDRKSRNESVHQLEARPADDLARRRTANAGRT